MKKTRVIGVDISEVNKAIKKLEDEGWEVVDTTVLQTESEILRDTRYVIAYIIAQKESDKSIYEKMYLLEQYCSKNHCRSGKCRIENMCSEYQGNGSFLWDFNDVEKAYEVIEMEIDKDGVKWYTKKELMELLKTAERVPMRNFNPYNIREMKFMLAKFCREEQECNGCYDCALLNECLNIPETLADWLLLQDTYDKEGMVQVEKLFNKLMDEGVF